MRSLYLIVVPKMQMPHRKAPRRNIGCPIISEDDINKDEKKTGQKERQEFLSM
jgi:hypothetical protein